ncbi:MAG: hypothetical protein ACRDLB_09475 [Actinomycetota bacterium]
MSGSPRIKRIRLLLALSVLASTASIVTASPAHACINPDEQTCQIKQAVCYQTQPAAKYRDKVIDCFPF